MKKNMKKWILTFALVLGFIGVIFAIKAAQIFSLLGFFKESEAAGMPPTPVATALVVEDKWETTLRFIGTLRAVQGVTLTAEVPGVVSSIHAENGSEVQAGDLLLTLDTALEEADLASAKARLRLAQVNLERTNGLLAKRIVAQSELDTAQAEFDEASAAVQNLEATIAKKRVRAPFAGRVGIRRVNLGQTVAVGDEFFPLHQSDPIYVEFSVPQTRLRYINVGERLRVKTDGLDAPVEGRVEAINPVVDEVTRTARVQGILRNPEEKLRAGQFAQVEVILPEIAEVLRVPASALLVEAFGSSVFVVEEDENGNLIARQQFVQTDRYQGDFVSVTRGLKAGQRIVSAGAFKLSPGMRIVPNDAMQPEAELHPQPPNS